MEDPRPSQTPNSSNDLFSMPHKQSAADKIKSMLSLQSEPSFTVTLEAVTVSVAMVIVLLIVVFYLGFLRGKDVERGEISRKITELKNRQHENLQIGNARTNLIRQLQKRPAAIQIPEGVTEKESLSDSKLTQNANNSNSVAITPRKPYTIQVVAYRSKSRAQSEVAQLTQKGYAARMVVQGSLFVVVVGEYSGRYDAQKDLRALKRIYDDSYLRKF